MPFSLSISVSIRHVGSDCRAERTRLVILSEREGSSPPTASSAFVAAVPRTCAHAKVHFPKRCQRGTATPAVPGSPRVKYARPQTVTESPQSMFWSMSKEAGPSTTSGARQ